MADDSEDASKKLADSKGEIRLPNAGRPSGAEMTGYASDPRAAATLRRIADYLSMPIDRFLNTPSSVKNDVASNSLNYPDQELRLLAAFARIDDSVARDQIIALAEALVPKSP